MLISRLGIKEVHLLPFHRMGEGKYRQLSKEYAYRNYESMSKQNLEKYVNKYQLLVKIGG